MALQVVKLKAFSKFENTTEALAAATALVDSKLSKGKPHAAFSLGGTGSDISRFVRVSQA